MNEAPRSEQLALLLNLIGDEAAEAALDGLDPDAKAEMHQTLEEMRADPPTEEEINAVLDDFERYLNFALDVARTEVDEEGEGESESGEESLTPEEMEEGFEVRLDPVKTFPKPKLTGDVKQDLNLLHPYQVAQALKKDQAPTISAVVKNLATEHAAMTLELLPEKVRGQVFVLMAQPLKIADKVVDTILRAALAEALKVDRRTPEEDKAQQMVELVRSLPKDVRGPMLEQLMETDEELAKSVKAQLYQFDDLVRLDDREIQKVLGQSSSDALVLALQGVDTELSERLLGNMSKRARQTIEEEMEFKSGAKQDEIDAGRQQIVEIITQLAESGEIEIG